MYFINFSECLLLFAFVRIERKVKAIGGAVGRVSYGGRYPGGYGASAVPALSLDRAHGVENLCGSIYGKSL